MKQERIIWAYKDYFNNFINTLKKEEARKIYYILDMLKVQERVSSKFVRYLRNELYELRAEYEGNIYRIFFIFDDGNVIILFNGFQKKSQKTPLSEITKALKIKEEYYESKQRFIDKH
ncbi:type II toxin-antitoxin system RelE/ParE family toxin [uncultured Bacteroides sp.]|uniref:type II toxin-antitoxin system RelE/ParE family toxin n=1 Tax=uncultured Bacteroides sp. TaxID=162156 RepID=UPI002618985B|nr:type II toxin-antitoxin system RelE/ParE family toxin [uncultured Bacteroides sp.]